ncbi:magnesium-translocating P-type ATPase [Paenalcaligenes suwonensis]|uniref:magnesium-translocating P-type ATPase n=1 Tax=Paenalcaligenes suwonensis TaxID=1202713 RepID=UPI00140DB001|nr:magnesium-translocating P-type ATPase [Paenalcaligenes suwonensis]NHC62797.1 magnesium-translocating P-type ATPase [Paenalcaligenes suwonensis]
MTFLASAFSRVTPKPAAQTRTLRAQHEAPLSLHHTLKNVGAHPHGLLHSDVIQRQQRDGLNIVAHEQTPSALRQFFSTFKNPFIVVLLVLAGISAITDIWLPWQAGHAAAPASMVIILTMVLASAVMRFIQEYRSTRSAAALKDMVRSTATVIRRRAVQDRPETLELPIEQLVEGDLIKLRAGDMIPADVRLVESRDLFVSQAMLTGESIPVEKQHTPALFTATEHNLLDTPNIGFMGTNVVSGTATAIVMATGNRSYFGALAHSIVGARSQTAFDRGVNSVSWLLIRFMLVMVPLVLLINGFSKGDWVEAFMFALAVAVGLTPEMLPMIVSANLAKGAMAMAKQKVVVKRLNAIQNFGAMDVLCTDKTGTLTQDKVILAKHVNTTGADDATVLQLAWLNSAHQSGVVNLIDQAVVRFAEASAHQLTTVKHWEKVDEIPFDFERRRLSVVVRNDSDEHLLICKGAVEEMLAVSSHIVHAQETVALTDARRISLLTMARAYHQDGFRVVVLATKQLGHEQHSGQYNASDEHSLVIRGLLIFLDPPKDSASAAMQALHAHGVTIKVLTGDNEIITSRICKEVGLAPGTALLGSEIELLDDATLRQKVEERTVFAKLTPLQKSRILKALQANGHTVGFLGDGINDAPALREADVGISVDSGADIAKESADIILLEKSLLVLEEGVIKGRETFGNILKYLNMTASSNFGNVLSVLIASAFIPFLPMLAIQLLIQNLLYDLSQLSLPWDKMDNEFLSKPRKWDARNTGRFMLFIGPTSSIFDLVTYSVLWFVFAANSPSAQTLFQSGWFIEGLLSQTLVVHMLRTQKIPFIQSTATLPVLLMTGSIMAIGLYLPFSALGPLVGLEALPWAYFPWLLGILLSYCVAAQLMKMLYIRRFGRWF